MKILIFNGSPKGERGNTQVMVESFSEGAREAGAEVETICLADKKINHCLGCFNCWIKTPGACAIKDDMAELLEKVKNTDILGFATPLYVDNVTGIMKNFMDRLLPLLDPHFEKDASGECYHRNQFKKVPKLMMISNCGFPEQSHFQVLKLLFRRIARNMQSEVIAEIYRSGGALLKEHPLILKPFIWKYKSLLKKAGKETATNLGLSPETIAELEKPIIPDEYYIKGANESFDKAISKRK